MEEKLRFYTTFRLGGGCRELRTTGDAAAAAAAIREWNDAGVPWRVMGGGSNLLVADEGLDEAILRFQTEGGDHPLPEWTREGAEMAVSAAVSLDAVAALAAEAGWAGMGFASGIPGTVGGAVAGNAGAFGRQTSDVVAKVEILTREGERRMLAGEQLDFGYRRSAVPGWKAVVTRVWLRLTPGDADLLREERRTILEERKEKHPDWRIQRTAGSFFKNLPPAVLGGRRQAAGRLLEEAGAKEMRVGGAYVFERHANILMADETATARDVQLLAARLQACVADRTGVTLEPEVRFWGFDGGGGVG